MFVARKLLLYVLVCVGVWPGTIIVLYCFSGLCCPCVTASVPVRSYRESVCMHAYSKTGKMVTGNEVGRGTENGKLRWPGGPVAR